MRMAYGDYLQSHMVAAETATNANFLNAKGRALKVTTTQLFTSGPSVANAYASEELLDFWRDHPRLTLAAFERQWVDQQGRYDWDSPAAA